MLQENEQWYSPKARKCQERYGTHFQVEGNAHESRYELIPVVYVTDSFAL
jgi:hypothetical protein